MEKDVVISKLPRTLWCCRRLAHFCFFILWPRTHFHASYLKSRTQSGMCAPTQVCKDIVGKGAHVFFFSNHDYSWRPYPPALTRDPRPADPRRHSPSPERKFNFVEYPPESKKLPSGKEIVKMMEEREAKRRIAAARAGIDAHLAAAAVAKRVSEEGDVSRNLPMLRTMICSKGRKARLKVCWL